MSTTQLPREKEKAHEHRDEAARQENPPQKGDA